MAKPLPILQPVAPRAFVILVGASVQQRAAICHAAAGEAVHIEPLGSPAELGARELETADVLLAWDEGERIAELTGQLAIAGSWAPVVAISHDPSVAQVVQAIKAGAIDYVDWSGEFAPVQSAIAAAIEARAKVLPRRQRQMEARARLQSLTPRERQVLAAMAQGMTNRQIAEVLHIAPRTVEIHRAHMMDKIDAKHSADAIRMALEASLDGQWLGHDRWSAPWSLNDLLLPGAPPLRDTDDKA